MQKNKIKLMLGKMIANFTDVTHEGITYTYEGAPDYGTEVFIENEDGELIPAENGEFIVDEKTYTIETGVITLIDGNPKEEMEDPKEEDPKEEDPKEEDPKEEDPKEEDPKEEDPKEPEEKLEDNQELINELEELKERISKLEELLIKSNEEMEEFKSAVKAMPMAVPATQEIKNTIKTEAKGAGKYFQALANE